MGGKAVALALAMLSTAGYSQRSPVRATLPNGRTIAPAGTWTELAPYPFALAARPDGKQLVAPSLGFPFTLNIVDEPGDSAPTVRRIPADGKNAADVQVHTGVAYSPDGSLLYDATGDSGAVDVLRTDTFAIVERMALDGVVDGHEAKESFAAALALSSDGSLLYVLDQGNWRVVVIDTRTRERVAAVPTGANPFTLCLSSDGKRLFVTNSGLFEYKRIQGADTKNPLHTGLRFPPTAYPSRQARQGLRVEGHHVPGLGPENDPRGSSVWTYELADARRPRLASRLRLGATIGESGRGAIGGAAPAGIAAGNDGVYVALAHEDALAILSPDGSRLLAQVPLSPFVGREFEDRQERPLRGVMPSGVALAGDRVYVTEAGINAVAVVDTHTRAVLGHLPVGWNPSAAVVSPDGRQLYVVNTKGQGTGPNAGAAFERSPHGRGGDYIGRLEFGSLSTIPLEPTPALGQGTTTVLATNEAALAPGIPSSRAKHVFFIIRENRTFDEVLGDQPGVNGDAALARFGMHGFVEHSDVKDLCVTPNAHALAAQFATSDNFYVDGDVSADGHRWALGIAPTPWMNLAWVTNYGGRRHANTMSDAPGRRALGGGADAPMPEDEPEFGSLWEHVADSNLPILNYGEGLEVEGNEEADGTEPEGQRLLLNSPLPKPVFESSDRRFPTFNLGIPDQMRFAEFRRDFNRRLAAGRLPALIVLRLPGDHTATPRPQDGYPYRASYVADNDLALGKIVEYLSHTRIWKDSAVFAIEDDAQSGVDHVDAHRSVLLAMGPGIRRGYIAHRHVSMGSVQKTIYEMLGIGPLNLEDALAADLTDMLTAQLDLEPYTALAADPKVFDPAKARIARPKTKTEAAELLDCDDPEQIEKEFEENQLPRRATHRN
jgi:YVTN family beta-propeller protein